MTLNKKKIAYVSGTRADFGLMRPVLKAISAHPRLTLQLYTTGMHLMPEFGYTHSHVIKYFPNAKKVAATFRGNIFMNPAEFAGDFLKKLITQLIKERPDIILVLGDRQEMLCAAMAGLSLNIPIAHIHGGDKTSTNDEVIRHAITKLSHIHFPAIPDSAKRIESMGEEKWRIHVVGAPALDFILNEKLPNRSEILKKLGINHKEKFILLTQHPVTQEVKRSAHQIAHSIDAIKIFNMPTVIVYPNADPGSEDMIKIINKEKNNPQFRIIPSLEYKDFLAAQREAAVWVGNSSGAMIESSSFGIPVVNVGTRQNGRQRGANIIDTGYNKKDIAEAIKKSLDPEYINSLKKIKNPWGDGKTGPRIAKILSELKINDKLLNKQISY